MNQTIQYVERKGVNRQLLLLHGTGGNENSLLDLADFLDPTAAVLSPRGQSLDEGAPRFFRRLREGVFDQEDLRAKTEELAEFVHQQRVASGTDLLPLIAVGYSNGANMALSMMLRKPGLFQGAVLLRPMVPFKPEGIDLVKGVPIWIGAGKNDPLVSIADSKDLEAILVGQGGLVELNWSETGHSLSMEELQFAKLWLTNLAL